MNETIYILCECTSLLSIEWNGMSNTFLKTDITTLPSKPLPLSWSKGICPILLEDDKDDGDLNDRQ